MPSYSTVKIGFIFFYQVSVYVHYNNTSKSLIESANIFFVYRS